MEQILRNAIQNVDDEIMKAKNVLGLNDVESVYKQVSLIDDSMSMGVFKKLYDQYKLVEHYFNSISIEPSNR